MSETNYPLFVISIREERLKEFMAQPKLQPLANRVGIIHGVNGETLDKAQIAVIHKPINKWNALRRGELGCYLSHMSAWQTMVDQSIPYALIMEDDCIMPDPQDLERALQEVHRIDPNWKIYLLARNPQFKRNARILTPDICVPSRSWGLFCYFVTLEGARTLLGRGKPIKCAVDVYVSSLRTGGKYSLVNDLTTVRKVRSDTVNIQ